MATQTSLRLASFVLALAACGTKTTQDSPPATAAEAPSEAATSAPIAATPSAPSEPSASATPARPGCAQNFGVFDANADSRVSLQEFLAQPHARPDAEGIFASRDADADGSLTSAEFCSGWGPGCAPGMGGGSGMGPRRGPGMSMGPGMGTAHGGSPRCDEHFAHFDANADGNVTESEFAALPHPHADAEEVFVARDQNHDGLLTKAEFCAAWTPAP